MRSTIPQFGCMLALAIYAAPAAQQRALTPTVIWIPDAYHTGGSYTAIEAAPDGSVYLGTTSYDAFGYFMVLPPGGGGGRGGGGGEFRPIANTAQMTGERTPGINAQAKIHTKPAIAADGRVYFGTKSGEGSRDEVAQAGYPGGHLLVYDPAADRVTDLGIIRKRQSIIAVGVDQRRNRVYALTDPDGHLHVYDPARRTFTDVGQLGTTLRLTRYLVTLANGDVYHADGDSAFTRYNAAKGIIERVPLTFTGRGAYSRPYALAPSTDGSRFHGVGEPSGEMYTFVPGERSIAVERHGTGQLDSSMFAPSTPRTRGRGRGRARGAVAAPVRISHYTITSAPDGNVYYTRNVGGEDLYLMRLVTRTGRPEVVGRVGDTWNAPFPLTNRRNGDRLIVEGSTATPDGTVYVMLAYPLRVLAFPRLAGSEGARAGGDDRVATPPPRPVAEPAPAKKKIAFIAESWYPRSHADVIGTRFLEGYRIDGRTYSSPLTVFSVYNNAPRANDMTAALAQRYGLRAAVSVADALLERSGDGPQRLAVDGVVVETREDPANSGQNPSPTPRVVAMRELYAIIERTRTPVPVFLDKMIAANWDDAQEILREAKRLRVPLMAGSVLPHTPVEPPLRSGAVKVGVAIASGPYWAFAFHAAELLQGTVMERRGERERGIASVREVGASYWTMPDRALWGGRTFDSAMAIARTARTSARPARGRARGGVLDPQGSVLLIEYVDGARAVVALVPRAFNDSEMLVGAEYADGSIGVASQILQPAPFDHFGYLVHALADFYTTGRSRIPVERTMLTTGLVLAGAESRKSGREVRWPSLAIEYTRR